MGGSGAGSGGGGGSSGTVDYPDYMKSFHGEIHYKIKDLVAKAQANNPYTFLQAWSPNYHFLRINAAVACFSELVSGYAPYEMWCKLAGIVPNRVIDAFPVSKFMQYLDGPPSTRIDADAFEASIYEPDWDTVFDPELLPRYLKKVPLDYFYDDSAINEFIDVQMERVCDRTGEDLLPRYRRGMQNIGAVMTSAYKIGEALIWSKAVQAAADLEKETKMKISEKTKDIRGQLALSAYEYNGKLALTRYDYQGKFALLIKELKGKWQLTDADLKDSIAKTQLDYMGKLGLLTYEAAWKPVDNLLQISLQKINFHKDVMHYIMESMRMGYTAWKEYTDTKNIYDIEKVKWDLEMMKYLMDSLGCISASAGTSYTTSASGTSRVASAVGGALTGASGGMMIGAAMGSGGGPIGAAIGGAVGLIGGLL